MNQREDVDAHQDILPSSSPPPAMEIGSRAARSGGDETGDFRLRKGRGRTEDTLEYSTFILFFFTYLKTAHIFFLDSLKTETVKFEMDNFSSLVIFRIFCPNFRNFFSQSYYGH